MTVDGDLAGDMARPDLDRQTAERLLQGRLSAEDVPAPYAEVACLFQAAAPAGASHPGPLPGEAQIVAVVADAVRSTPPAPIPSRRKSVFTKAKLAAAGLAGALSLTTGLAAANALPGAAQGVASDALAKVGVNVPSPNSHSNGHADTRGKSGTHTSGDSSSSKGPNAHADFGLCTAAAAHERNGAQPHSTVFPSATTCSTVAHPGSSDDTNATDAGKPASPGSQADDHKPSATPPVSTPNGGGTATADTASDGHSSGGTSTANTASDGHSSAGSGNAGSHRP